MLCSEIHVWGDSLARGVVYNEQRARYAISRERCTTRLSEAMPCKVENHSGMGATVRDGLNWFGAFTGVPGALCAVEFGGNDCDLNWPYVATHPDEPVTPKVPLPEFEALLSQFVTLIRARDMQPLLITPLPLHAERYYHWVTQNIDADAVLKALGDVNHIYRWQERYANAVRKVARATRCNLFDLRDVFLSRQDYEQLMCVDGIHPNESGHRVLADAALAFAQDKANQPASLAEQEAAEAYVTMIPSATRLS